MEWFVYCDKTYYPFAATVDATTAEAAAAAFVDEHGGGDERLMVFPRDALAFRNFDRDGEVVGGD